MLDPLGLGCPGFEWYSAKAGNVIRNWHEILLLLGNQDTCTDSYTNNLQKAYTYISLYSVCIFTFIVIIYICVYGSKMLL